MELIKLVLGLAAPLALSGQVNLSGVWRWDRPANDTNSNRASQMWKKSSRVATASLFARER
jgi:hypothetical protein